MVKRNKKVNEIEIKGNENPPTVLPEEPPGLDKMDRQGLPVCILQGNSFRGEPNFFKGTGSNTMQ